MSAARGKEKFCAKCGQRVTALPSFAGDKIYHFNCAPDDAEEFERSMPALHEINREHDREAMSKARSYLTELLSIRGEDDEVRRICEKAIEVLK